MKCGSEKLVMSIWIANQNKFLYSSKMEKAKEVRRKKYLQILRCLLKSIGCINQIWRHETLSPRIAYQLSRNIFFFLRPSQVFFFLQCSFLLPAFWEMCSVAKQRHFMVGHSVPVHVLYLDKQSTSTAHVFARSTKKALFTEKRNKFCT